MNSQAQAQPATTVRVFTQRFSATRRGARLARLLTLHQLDDWGFPYSSSLSETAGLVVAELATNAATHGRVRGRDFVVALTLTATTLHIEVTDTRTDRTPPTPDMLQPPEPDADTGRGLLLVDALSARWGVTARTPHPGKTVWTELDLAVF